MSDLHKTAMSLREATEMDLAAYRSLARENRATIHRLLEENEDMRMELHAAQPDGLPPPFPKDQPDGDMGSPRDGAGMWRGSHIGAGRVPVISDEEMDASVTADILAEIANAVAKGRAKFPGNRFMLSALMEEVGELARALLQRKGEQDVRREAMDVIVVALRIFLEGDATFDDITPEESKP